MGAEDAGRLTPVKDDNPKEDEITPFEASSDNLPTAKLRGTKIGYLHRQDNGLIGFQYDYVFLASGIEVAPIKMPLSNATYTFPALSEEPFNGLPGMLADSLSDKFGNIVIKLLLKNNAMINECIAKTKLHIQKRSML